MSKIRLDTKLWLVVDQRREAIESRQLDIPTVGLKRLDVRHR